MSKNTSDQKRAERTENRGEQQRPVPMLIALFEEPRCPNDCDHRSAFYQVAVAEKNNRLVETRGDSLNVIANSANLVVGQTYFIVQNTSLAADVYGTFSNGATVTDSNGDTFAISYTAVGGGDLIANDISLTVLTVVPEPSTWGAAALALGAVVFAQRRRLRGYWLSVRGS